MNHFSPSENAEYGLSALDPLVMVALKPGNGRRASSTSLSTRSPFCSLSFAPGDFRFGGSSGTGPGCAVAGAVVPLVAETLVILGA